MNKTPESGTNGLSVARLTHKAIARMAGFRVEYVCARYRWYDVVTKDWGSPVNTEDDAWIACCIDNGLIEPCGSD